ncbi:MAG: alpha/beta hydrolase [Termitinemataceae bacterium]
MKLRQVLLYILCGLIAASMLVIGGFLLWAQLSRYPAYPEATLVALQADRSHGWYSFIPSQPTEKGIIFYPGALVAVEAYAPLLKAVSERGILVVAVPMPLELAIFGISKADAVVQAFPTISAWAIAGHSLGGAMAAQYLTSNSKYSNTIKALILLASYPPPNTSLKHTNIRVLSLYGDRDLGPTTVFEESKDRLPEGSTFVFLPGANHAQFGHYGPQKGDGTAAISREAQQKQTVDAIVELLTGL